MPGIGSKSNLVIDDDVNRSVRGIIWQIWQMHRFEDDTLATEGGVSV